MSKEDNLVDRYADELRDEIESGVYGTSGTIPSQKELMARWQTKNRWLVSEVILLLRCQGHISQIARGRYRVLLPKIELDGLTPNFKSYLEERYYQAEEEDLQPPTIERMPKDVAAMFVHGSKPAIEQGLHVVHRVRKQGIVDIPLRIGHIWYPAELAEPYLAAMKQNSSFDMLAALKRDSGIIVEVEDTATFTRIPEKDEMKILNVARYQPLLEIRRICYTANRGMVVALHRTIMDGTKFVYRQSRNVTHWK